MQTAVEGGAAERAGARILDGAALSQAIREGLAPRVHTFIGAAGRPPTLGLLLAGDNAGSEIYVRNKMRQSEALGIATDLRRLPATASFREALAIVEEFNAAAAVDGILVQSPLPAGMGAAAEARIFDAIAPAKDVDGFSPISAGRLLQHRAGLVPCTPAGVMALLDHAAIEIAGRRAVVIGRSDIVGKPMALLLLHRHATVTICHSRTADLPRVAAAADILVAAIGRPAFVTRDFVKPGGDGDRRRHQRPDRPAGGRRGLRAPARGSSRRSIGGGACSPATCTRTWRRWRARSPPCPAGSVR